MKTLVLDFDGVIHNYASGWQGPRTVADPPVPGAIDFLLAALLEFEVAILSSRSRAWGGRRAMKSWLHEHLCTWLVTRVSEDGYRLELTPFFDPKMEPWEVEIRDWATGVVRQIKWPLYKPSAFLTIDDRALCFDGTFPSLTALHTFRPWNKR